MTWLECYCSTLRDVPLYLNPPYTDNIKWPSEINRRYHIIQRQRKLHTTFLPRTLYIELHNVRPAHLSQCLTHILKEFIPQWQRRQQKQLPRLFLEVAASSSAIMFSGKLKPFCVVHFDVDVGCLRRCLVLSYSLCNMNMNMNLINNTNNSAYDYVQLISCGCWIVRLAKPALKTIQ